MKVRATRTALADLRRLHEYIARHNPAAASAMIDRVEAAFARLANFPEIGRPGRAPGTRELVISRTPFIAPYRIEGRVVTVLAVVDGRQLWPSSFEH